MPFNFLPGGPLLLFGKVDEEKKQQGLFRFFRKPELMAPIAGNACSRSE
jgi:hypothetical protein